MATATACLLQGALRALRRTSGAPSAAQSTIIASYLWRVSLLKAESELAQSSISISRSPSTRRNTRTIFSSEHNTRDFRVMAACVLSSVCPTGLPLRTSGAGQTGHLSLVGRIPSPALYVHRLARSTPHLAPLVTQVTRFAVFGFQVDHNKELGVRLPRRGGSTRA